MKFAYLGFPGVGGPCTFYRNLRSGLAPAGIDVRWLGSGPWAHRALMDARWSSERPFGGSLGHPMTMNSVSVPPWFGF